MQSIVFAYEEPLRGKEYLINHVNYKHLSDIRQNENYIYPIAINVVNDRSRNRHFFNTFKDIGFNNLSERVISDVKNGNSKIVILFPSEGCTTKKELTILENWCKDKCFTKKQVYLIHGNHKLEGSDYFTYISINFFLGWVFVSDNFKFDYKPVDSKNIFLCYNRRRTYARTVLVCELLENNIFNRGLISYLNFTYTYTSINESINESIYNHAEYKNRNYLSNLQSGLSILNNIEPVLLDITDINFNPAHNLILEHYQQTLLSIVTETVNEPDIMFFSEKTWKPIAAGHPFILVSSIGSLAELKKLGYRTFNKWWSEEYDNESNINIRINMIVKELIKLSNLSTIDLINMRNDMIEVVDFNRKLFNSYRNQNVKTVLYSKVESIWNDFNLKQNI